MKKLAAEFIGTFALVFAGTGAIVINDATGGVVTSMSKGPHMSNVQNPNA